MAKLKKKKTPGKSYALSLIVVMLLGSSVIRFGSAGFAIASEDQSDDSEAVEEPGLFPSPPLPNISELLNVIQERTAELDALEETLEQREARLKEAEVQIKNSLLELEEAEKKLSDTLARVDGASENDLERLTSVYQTMKPKNAAAIFEEMDAAFAAGFLARMNPNAAAEIMANMGPESAHAITVVVAGRNALVPKE